MGLDHLLLLAIVQGLTEFLPISSSAHLILAPKLFGLADQGLAFDIAIHLGSLGAVILYFRQQLVLISRDFILSLTPKGQATENSRLAWFIIVATIPIVIAGLLFKLIYSGELRSASVIAAATIIFGLLLWWADYSGARQRDINSMTWKDAWIIGLMQCLAIIPGTSRSGITITAALMLGIKRESAAQFSFLLAIPTILMSGTLVIVDIIKNPTHMDLQAMLIGSVLSFIAAYICIALFLKVIDKIGMLPFVIYRMILAAIIIVWLV